MPTMATAYNTGLPVSISGITTNDHGRHAAQPSSIIRRRPTRSHRRGRDRDGRDARQPAQHADRPDEVARIAQVGVGVSGQIGVGHVDEGKRRPARCPRPGAISRRCRRSTSASGALGTRSRAFSSANTGVSSMLSRTYRAMHDQHRADQERQPPSPLHERGAVFADGEVHDQEGQAAQHRRGAAAEQGEHAVPAAFAGGRVLGAQQRRPGPFDRRRRTPAAAAARSGSAAPPPRWTRCWAPGPRSRSTRAMISSVATSVFLRPSRSPK